MAKFTPVKTWADGERFRSGAETGPPGLNDLVSGFGTAVNNIIDDQIAANAAIQGSKFATTVPVPGTKVEGKAVTPGKFAAANVMGITALSDDATSPVTLSVNDTDYEVTFEVRTVSGGLVVMTAVLTFDFAKTYDSDMWIYGKMVRVDHPSLENPVPLRLEGMKPYNQPGNSDGHHLSLFAVDVVPAGSYRWRLLAEKTEDNTPINPVVRHAQQWIWELR